MTWYKEKNMVILKPGLSLWMERLDNPGCTNGHYPAYQIRTESGDVVYAGVTCRCGRGCSNTDCIRDDWGYHDTDIEKYRAEGSESEPMLINKYPFSGNAIQAAADAIASRELNSATIVKISDDEYYVATDAGDTSSTCVYAAIDEQTVRDYQIKYPDMVKWWIADKLKAHLINDATRRKAERGEPRKKDHREYSRISLGGSDIASIILRDSRGVRELRFGEDGSYSAYLVDAECDIPDYYTLEAECKSWLSVYDDSIKTFEVQNPKKIIRVYRAGEFGCIIQKM